MIGQTVSHYQITEQLGQGGMGVVYKATDTKLGRTVALKFLPRHTLGTGDDNQRFHREARAAAQLNHPNICTIHEIDEAEGQTFIAMEFVEGETLAQKIKQGPLKLNAVIDMAVQVAAGLQAAHERGIVHRDVKSSNVMVTDRALVKIVDFGLAKVAAQTPLTKTGSTLGTVAYMSPEQARGEAVDQRTDLWSLGVVLYEMIVGRLPFPGDYEQAVVYGILNVEPEPLTALRPKVPGALEQIVSMLLEKEPDERYANMNALLVDLRRLQQQVTSEDSKAPEARPAPSIAVLPFVNMSADPEQEYFCDGMAEELI
ncbi:MAG: protein kinase, partial [Bacteroidetes bacterium]|nr:protein kinase [Bacteroidota bacterium]